MTKITYIAAIDTAIESMTAQNVSVEIIDKMRALRASIEKRNSADRKPTPKETAKADADAVLTEKVREVLASIGQGTVTEIKDASEDFAEVKVQKLSAIVRKMLLNGEVIREEVKRKAVFRLA